PAAGGDVDLVRGADADGRHGRPPLARLRGDLEAEAAVEVERPLDVADDHDPVVDARDPHRGPRYRGALRAHRQTYSRVSGLSLTLAPGAWATALAIAAGAGSAPPSPAPLTPSGFSGEGVTTCWT